MAFMLPVPIFHFYVLPLENSISDTTLHNNSARASRPHAPRSRGEKESAECETAARGSFQTDARRGNRLIKMKLLVGV